jgi:hypothetical protein
LAKASSLLFPSLMQPGREGTYTVKPPSSLGSSTILSFTICHLSRLLKTNVTVNDTIRHREKAVKYLSVLLF